MFINDIFKKKLNEGIEVPTIPRAQDPLPKPPKEKGVEEDAFDDTHPYDSYVSAKRTITSTDGDEKLRDRTASIDTDIHGRQRVRAIDNDEITTDRTLPKGVQAKLIPQYTKQQGLDEAHGPYGKIKSGDLEKIQKAKEREKKNAPGQLRQALPPSKQRYRDSSIEYFAKLDERDVKEGSAQDRLHRRHQELRKKSGLPDPDYYKELKASYEIENDQERLARQTEIKKKYRVMEDSNNRFKSKDDAIAYAKEKVQSFRDKLDGIEIWKMPDGSFDVVHTMNSNGRRWCIDNGGHKLGTIYDRTEDVAEGRIQRSTYKGSAGAQAIAQASGVKNVNKIIPGQRLNIPGQDTPYIVQKGDTLDAIASRFSGSTAAPEPELTGRIDGSDSSNPDAKEIRKPRLATSVKNAQRASWGDETSDPAGEVVPMSRRLLARSVTNAQAAGKIRDSLPGDTDKVSQKIDGQIAATTDTADNTTTTQSVDSTNVSAPALNKHLDFVNKEPTNEQGVAEAGPFSYGAKKPRKGSVADLAAQKRREQEKNKKPIEPKDQMVGVAKVVTNEDIEGYLEEMSRAGYDIVTERATSCPECGGVAYADQMLAEKQDACYHKVKSRYKVWPSAYASGALVRCRKVGAKNWGNKSKK
jgi:hypothetical protein